MSPDLTIVHRELQFPRVSLVVPSRSAYTYIAAEVDARPAFLWSSSTKRALVKACKRWCRQLRQEVGVVEAVMFTAVLVPPGRGEFIERRADEVHVARFDFAVLIETVSLEIAARLKQHRVYRAMLAAIEQAASRTYCVDATNVRRIDRVDHRRDGVFLFNHFFADDTEQNLRVWEYTAGWFQHETGLDNSTVLLPVQRNSGYNLINHCRWDRLGDILPSLLFKSTFHSYVLDNFAANNVAAMPILFRLA